MSAGTEPFSVGAADGATLSGHQYLLDHSARLSAAVLSGTTALDEIAALLDPSAEIDLSMFNAGLPALGRRPASEAAT